MKTQAEIMQLVLDEIRATKNPPVYDEHRKLSNGMIKDGRTGIVYESTCRNRADIPKDLGSNFP